MKKQLILSSVICALMLAVSCSNGGNDPTKEQTNVNEQGQPNGTEQEQTGGIVSLDGKTYIAENPTYIKGDTITFNITKDSTNAEDTKFIIDYPRSSYAAKERVTIIIRDLIIKVNGQKIDSPKVFDFKLNSYGGSFTNPSIKSGIENKNEDDMVSYNFTFSLNKKLNVGDVVTFEGFRADAYGEGSETANLESMTIVLLDTSEEANWYTQIADNSYIPFINNVNSPGEESKKDKQEWEFKDGHLYIINFDSSSDNYSYSNNFSYSISGNTIKRTIISFTQDGVTTTVEEAIKDYISEMKEEGLSEAEIQKELEDIKSNLTDTTNFIVKEDSLILIGESDGQTAISFLTLKK